MLNDLELTEMLCARLCHDLAGPLGAVASGAELLGDDPDPETAGLVASTAAGAVSRLRLLRVALGGAGGPRPEEDVRALLQAYLEAGASAAVRLDLIWHSGRPDLAGETVRLVLALAMVARESLPRGGRLSVEIEAVPPGGSLGLAVGFHGPSARLDPDSRVALGGAGGPIGPRVVLACWVSRLAARAHSSLVVEDQVDGGWIKA
ncbi:histidine phosphotransferase family protein [Magnetospirillum fulvum]|uniref:Histidine phosphotransferase ChpT n=1 Tax=Magnetospirillum fulvum TaxID=1082 RepID=A0A1H6JPX6_MAGFU|nr:histidine phosphotransferase family protein [Magnetospirillum fulvum]SEH61241.1 histidine phosphotransferase ChpT [Magnetospirillum fulvum]